MNVLEVGKTRATKQPKIFFVNWFRPDEDCWVAKWVVGHRPEFIESIDCRNLATLTSWS